MGDLADVYESTRRSIIELLRSRDEQDLETSVPATPEWSVRDVVCHLIGDVDCLLKSDFPKEFFQSFGDAAAVVTLNEWTQGHLVARKERTLDELVEEWDELTTVLTSMMRGEKEWPSGIAPFADRVLVTDLGVHQQDLYGAFGIERDRDGPPVKIGAAGYIAIMGLRLQTDGVGTMAIEVPDKRWVAGGDEPDATLRTDRFELFRALSGRRSMDQLRAYEWSGDPEPFLSYFFPYGVREEALVE